MLTNCPSRRINISITTCVSEPEILDPFWLNAGPSPGQHVDAVADRFLPSSFDLRLAILRRSSTAQLHLHGQTEAWTRPYTVRWFIFNTSNSV